MNTDDQRRFVGLCSPSGGLSSKMMFLRGSELTSMYPECRSDDWIR